MSYRGTNPGDETVPILGKKPESMLVTTMEDVAVLPVSAVEIKGVDLSDDALLSAVKHAGSLQRIDLLGCESLTDASVARLASITSLEEIDLGGCHLITDATPKALSVLPRLRVLSLGFCYQITDVSLEALGRTSSLEKLLLWSCEAISDRGITAIAELPKLSWLELPELADISDDGVGALARTGSELTVLKFLQLDQISDRGVVGLRQLSKLRRLQIEGCKHVTESAIEELQRALPECCIVYSK